MTISRLFAFWTLPLANVVRGLCLHLMLAFVMCASSITMRSHPVNAAVADQTGEAVEAASKEAKKECREIIDDVLYCRQYKLWVDPRETSVDHRATKVDRFHLEVSFDQTRFKFDPSGSGPFCSFADGGMPCPPSKAKLGTNIRVKEDDTPPGIPPAGANLCFSQPKDGVIVVDYTLARPVDLSSDQNIFVLAFQLVTPIRADVPVYASYFGTPGDHDFNQTEFSCNGGAIRCSGQPPIFGVDIRP